jgi:hypothetical protein
MTGHLTLPVGPAAANAVRKDYVDAAVTASQVFTPGGNIAATTVQGAIAELDAEKVKKSGDIMTGMLQINQAVGNTTSLVNFTDGTHYEFVTYQDASGYAEWDIDGAGPGGFGPGQSFSYARGTLSAPQAVHANDEVGFHYYYFHDGLNWLNAASLGAVAEGDPVPGVGTPTALSFKTGASNDSGIERLRIKSDGHVLLTLDPVVGLHVKILDRHVLAVGQDHNPAGWTVVEAKASGLLDVELAAKPLVVGARLYEPTFDLGHLVEITGDLLD